MKNTALTRSIPYWLLLVLSLAALGLGAWITTDQIGVMTTTLLDGTATGVEVYAGQAWVVFGGALVAGGIIGLFLALALAAAKALLPRPSVEVVETIDWTSADTDSEDTVESAVDPRASTAADVDEPAHATR
ncbi:hypothetical protein OED01_08745 [Microbacterium sp. M28]|uniref:hypothetical protein n=1 Tax=Microbacterium sp. M28 TaxID=2962064 RepID=UPI0021F4E3F6|nr:hypothetical protein [Microbacterium sp. M28]UYO95707.1 hypothetical protein OED01_08745 [Microbacterium sp. M28]